MPLWLLAVALQAPVDSPYARAESLLTIGRLDEARSIAEGLVRAHPTDPRARLLLGRVHLAWPVIGRYRALQEFRAAARLASHEPEPLYRQAEVGFYLGSDEGERIARVALLRLFALTPEYEDAWDRFGRLYRDRDAWEAVERALARHGDDRAALLRRAEAAVMLAAYARADSLLARAARLAGPSVPVFLWRARAAFEAGRDAAGYGWYDSAMVHADRDATGAMWEAVWMIASPEEVRRHAATVPGRREAFFRRFWDRRDPNLVTPENERIAEHFRRLAAARRDYRLLHPLNLFHRSAGYRALAGFGALDLMGRDLFVTRCDSTAVPGGVRVRCRPGYALGPLDSAAASVPRAPAVETGDAETVFARAGLDARGLLFVRHGPPDRRLPRVFDPLRPLEIETVSGHDVEGWAYDTPDGPLSIALARGTGGFAGGGFGGDFVFFPVTGRQHRSVDRLLATDATALPAPLAARFWTAAFKAAGLGLTDTYYRTAPDTAAATLWFSDGSAAARARGPGLLTLTIPPGRYHLGVDVDSAGVVGRLRRDMIVPRFSLVELSLSSLVLARRATLGDRESMLWDMPADLTFPAGEPLAAYAEVYGLHPGTDGRVRYEVEYAFEPVAGFLERLFGADRPVVLRFTRDGPATAVVRERVVIDPGLVTPGRYRVMLAVTDLVRNVKSASAALEVTID